DLQTNTLYVSQDHDHPWLMSEALTTVDGCWVSGAAPTELPISGSGQSHGVRFFGVKTRYRQADAMASFAQGSGEEDEAGQGFALHFQDAQWAVTPGQSAVIYDGEICLGGGIIAEARSATS
ncbi:MAG: aminomethyltransferase beta-barrel domain-containing protein, partial [Burkholderiaceae bacterium]